LTLAREVTYGMRQETTEGDTAERPRSGKQALPMMVLPKGRLLDGAFALLEEAGIRVPGFAPRALWGSTTECRYVVSRGRDVPTYLRSGVAELGIVGHDIVLEAGQGLVELADLGFGACRIVLALPEPRDLRPGDRIATRYPTLTRAYLNGIGRPFVSVVPLAGAVEGAVTAGLADGVVEVVETGATLRAHGLMPVATVAESSARLVKAADRPLSAQAQWVVERAMRGLGLRSLMGERA